MFRIAAALLAACVLCELMIPAARAHAQAAEPFPVVPIETQSKRHHFFAYITMVSGAGLIGASFVYSKRADETYAEYLASTDPETIDALYDQTTRYDHLSQASLLTGEVLLVTGLYLRFIHHPSPKHVSLNVQPTRCWVACHF